MGHPTLRSGGKKTVKRYLKSEQTYTRTDGQIDLYKASAQRADALKILHMRPSKIQCTLYCHRIDNYFDHYYFVKLTNSYAICDV